MEITFAVAFTAGLLSFLSPCILALAPAYIAGLYGPDIFETGTNMLRLPLFLHSLSFVAGFSIIFVLLGVGAGLAGPGLNLNLGLARNVSGVLLLAAGLFMLASIKVPAFNFERRLNRSGRLATGYSRSLLTGVIFSIAWTPCAGPALGGILALAWSAETVGQSGFLLAVYSLGFALPFLAIGAAFDTVHPLLKKISRYSIIFYAVSGLLLITVGVLILTGQLSWLQGVLLNG